MAPTYAGTFGIDSANIEDNSITTNKIENNAVTTVKIVDGAVTGAKLGTIGLVNVTDATEAQGSISTNGRDYIPVATSMGAFTITVSSSDIGQGNLIYIFDLDDNAATNPITIATEGGETIDGKNTITIDLDGAGVLLHTDGTNLFSTKRRQFDRIANLQYVEAVVTGDITGATGLDLTAANFFRHTLTGDVTFSFNNPVTAPAGNSFTIITVQDGTGGRGITWPSSVEWDGGAAPTVTGTANAKDWWGFVSPDGGTTWLGVQSAANLS